MSRVGTSNESCRDTWVRGQLAALPTGWRLLDAGAGEQPFRNACTHLQYVSQDFGEYKPDEVDTGLQCPGWKYEGLSIVSDVAAIPEPDQAFDAVLCTEVLEHVPDPLAVIREFARLVRPGGRLLVTAPFLSLTHFAPYHFSTGFNRYFYETNLTAHGFRIDEISCNGNYFELVAQELRRVDSVAKRFSGQRVRRWERWAMRFVLRMLDRFSRHDRGSNELGCYGLHIVATRLAPAQHAAA